MFWVSQYCQDYVSLGAEEVLWWCSATPAVRADHTRVVFQCRLYVEGLRLSDVRGSSDLSCDVMSPRQGFSIGFGYT